jgi:site-specific DNA recombinase
MPYRSAMARRTLPRRIIDPTQTLRAALYGRASSDPKKRGRSIKDQFEDCQAECDSRSWTVVGRYEDRDRSASIRATKVREDFERMVADIEADLIDVIVYAERSRAARDLEVYGKLRKLCMRTGVLWCYGGRVYDLTKSSDRRDTARDALQSEEEADAISDRAERTARLNAHRGAPHGKIPFGYTRRYDPDDGHLLGQFAHPEHADVVRDLFERAAGQESIASLTLLLQKYVPDASRGGLRYLLANKTYLGVRTYNGLEMQKCQWPAIVDESVFWAVQDVLKDPERRTQRDSRAHHLLSGIAVCAVCWAEGLGHKAGLRAKTIGGALRYVCATYRHVGCRMDELDAVVEAALHTWLSSEAAVAAFETKANSVELSLLRTKTRNIKTQLEEARRKATEFTPEGFPLLSIESLALTEQQLLPMLAETEKRLRSLTSSRDPLIGRLVGTALAEVERMWNDGLVTSQRRHVLRRVVNVELRPARARGVHHLTVDRFELRFAGEEGFSARPERGTTGWVREK